MSLGNLKQLGTGPSHRALWARWRVSGCLRKVPLDVSDLESVKETVCVSGVSAILVGSFLNPQERVFLEDMVKRELNPHLGKPKVKFRELPDGASSLAVENFLELLFSTLHNLWTSLTSLRLAPGWILCKGTEKKRFGCMPAGDPAAREQSVS